MATDKLPVTLRDYFFHDPHFFTWENYEKVKDHVTKMSGDVLKSFDDHVRSMTGYSPMHMIEAEDGADKDAKKTEETTQMIPFPRNWMLPSMPGLKEASKALGLYTEGMDNELVRFQESADGFVLTLDTHLYRPSELHLTVKDGVFKISGKHEERDVDSKKVTIRQFQRMYTLPEGVTKEDVVSNLSADGVLVVTAKKGAAKQ